MAIPPDIARAYFAAKDGLAAGCSPVRSDQTFSLFYNGAYQPTLGVGKGAIDKIGRLNRFAERFGQCQMVSIKPEQCSRFVADLLTIEGLKPATVRKVIIELRLIFRMAVDRGVVQSNPFDTVKLPRVQNQRGVVLRDDQFADFHSVLNQFDAPFQGYVRLLELTGVRAGELLGLQWGDVDLDGRKVFLRQTKNGRSRTVPLSDAARHEFEKLQALKVAGNLFVFPGKVSGKPMSRPSKKFAQLCRMAGIEGLWQHDLRRTCATIAARHAPLHTVSRMLGHSSVAVTQRYLVTRDEDIADALDGVAACLTSGRK